MRSSCTGYGTATWPYGLLLGPEALHEKVVLHACRKQVRGVVYGFTISRNMGVGLCGVECLCCKVLVGRFLYKANKIDQFHTPVSRVLTIDDFLVTWVSQTIHNFNFIQYLVDFQLWKTDFLLVKAYSPGNSTPGDPCGGSWPHGSSTTRVGPESVLQCGGPVLAQSQCGGNFPRGLQATRPLPGLDKLNYFIFTLG